MPTGIQQAPHGLGQGVAASTPERAFKAGYHCPECLPPLPCRSLPDEVSAPGQAPRRPLSPATCSCFTCTIHPPPPGCSTLPTLLTSSAMLFPLLVTISHVQNGAGLSLSRGCWQVSWLPMSSPKCKHPGHMGNSTDGPVVTPSGRETQPSPPAPPQWPVSEHQICREKLRQKQKHSPTL